MGSAFHQLCPRYSGTLNPTAPMAIRLWETFTFSLDFISEGPDCPGSKRKSQKHITTRHWVLKYANGLIMTE